MKNVLIFISLFFLTGLNISAYSQIEWLDKNIALTPLTGKAWLIQTSYSCNGNLDCNHLLVIDSLDVVLVNTPATDSMTAVLLQSIEKKFHRKVTKVMVSHFHDDSAGGLTETNKRGIKSYGLDKTNKLLKHENTPIDMLFHDSIAIQLQTLELKLFYFGAGHSVDNMVTWFPGEKILFGGCLLKSFDSKDKGNIKDADIRAWPVTVQKVKDRFWDAKIVIPGHSSIGDYSLFDHTLEIVNQ